MNLLLCIQVRKYTTAKCVCQGAVKKIALKKRINQ